LEIGISPPVPALEVCQLPLLERRTLVTTTSLPVPDHFEEPKLIKWSSEEGKLVKWHIGEGQPVLKGQVLAEIEDQYKEIQKIEAPESGTIQLLYSESASLHPHSAIAVVHPNERTYDWCMMVPNVMEAGIRNIVQRELQPIKDALRKIMEHLNLK
jgi:Na+-translocating ferredoxin:NAD+ oxidoreductase RnfC subunit